MTKTIYLLNAVYTLMLRTAPIRSYETLMKAEEAKAGLERLFKEKPDPQNPTCLRIEELTHEF